MAVWPFWRRHRRGRRSPNDDEEDPKAAAKGKKTVASPPRQSTAPLPEKTTSTTKGVTRTPSRRKSRRKRRGSNGSSKAPPVPQPPPKAKDFATAPAADEEGDKPQKHALGSVENVTALPGTKELRRSPHLRPATCEYADIPYNFQLPAGSRTSIPSAKERGKLQRPHSMQHKSNTSESILPRRKSSKRRKDDHIREEEIRAMSSSPPNVRRPATFGPGPMRHDSKKGKGGLNRRFQRRPSDVSIPTEDSIHSSMSGSSEPHAFKISALAVFTPRPTIRYTISPHDIAKLNQTMSLPAHAESGRDKRIQVAHETIKESRRIDTLADNLDAGALRELMERDRRRTERKRQTDIDKVARRLQRRAEKQKADEQKAEEQKAAEDVTDVGLGLEQKRESTEAPRQPEPRETAKPGTYLDYPAGEHIPVVPAQLHDAELESPRSETAPESPFEEPVVSTAQAVRYSQASMSTPGPASPTEPTRAPSISQVMDRPSQPPSTAATPSEAGAADQPPDPRRASEPNARRIGTWASIFRRGTKRLSHARAARHQQPPHAASEHSFSNTSRESMARQPLPPHLLAAAEAAAAAAHPRRFSAGTPPLRTTSKFREELPEMPLSPPDSRLHSPETATAGADAIATRRGYMPPSKLQVEHGAEESTPDATAAAAAAAESKGGGSSGGTGRTDSPVSPSPRGDGRGSTSAPMQHSLASVDSEASWLSGRPAAGGTGKRSSNLRSSLGSASLGRRHESLASVSASAASGSYEELGGSGGGGGGSAGASNTMLVDDEYFRRLTPTPEHHRRSPRVDATRHSDRRASSSLMVDDADTEDLRSSVATARPDDDDDDADDDEGEIRRGDVARKPTVVHASDARARSTEGLLNQFDAPTPPPPPAPGRGPASDDNIAVQDPHSRDDSPASHPSNGSAGAKEGAEELVVVQRAQSVDFGKGHVRHLSAGSAKLLDIPAKRQSGSGGESRRTSAAASAEEKREASPA